MHDRLALEKKRTWVERRLFPRSPRFSRSVRLGAIALVFIEKDI